MTRTGGSLGFEATGPANLLRGELHAAATLVFAQAGPGGVEPGPDVPQVEFRAGTFAGHSGVILAARFPGRVGSGPSGWDHSPCAVTCGGKRAARCAARYGARPCVIRTSRSS